MERVLEQKQKKLFILNSTKPIDNFMNFILLNSFSVEQPTIFKILVVLYFIFVGLVGKEKYDPSFRFFPLGPFGGIASIIGVISVFVHYDTFSLPKIDTVTYYSIWVVFINSIITTFAFLSPNLKLLKFGLSAFYKGFQTSSIFEKIIKNIIGFWLIYSQIIH